MYITETGVVERERAVGDRHPNSSDVNARVNRYRDEQSNETGVLSPWHKDVKRVYFREQILCIYKIKDQALRFG